MKITTYLLALAAVAMMACTNEVAQETSKQHNQSDPQIEYAYYAPWVYVVDFRYGRGCINGGGFCFENEWGDVFYYGIENPDNGDMEDIHTAEINEPLATLAMRLESTSGGENLLHLLLTREAHIDGFGEVPTNIELSPDLAQQLGVTSITMLEGNYEVAYDEFPSFGKVSVPCNVQE